MVYARVGVVTGANKGIGLAIVRQLALEYPKSPLSSGSLLIYLTARDQSRGEAAVADILKDSQLIDANALRSGGGATDIVFHQLDITDNQSLKSITSHIKEHHKDGIDFVINNAGIALRGFDANVVKTTLECNYYSTMEASHQFLILLKPTGRLVNVASISGSLDRYSSDIRNRFLKSKTEDDVTSILEDFASAVKRGDEKEAGFPSAAYAVSKAGLIGATRALAVSEKQKGNLALINSCCPGWVITDMTRGAGNKTPEQGAQTPVMLAIQDIDNISGSFWQNEKVKDWSEFSNPVGKVQ